MSVTIKGKIMSKKQPENPLGFQEEVVKETQETEEVVKEKEESIPKSQVKLGLNEVELPCGFFFKYEDKFHCLRVVKIREMTGKIYKDLGTKKIRSNPALLNSMILEQCVERLQGFTLRPAHYEQFLVADQNYLVMKIRQLSKGDTAEATVKCTNCDEKLESEINLDDLDVIRLPEPSTEEVEKGYRTFEYKDESLGLKATFRYPMIMDINKVGPVAQENAFEAQDLMLEGCLMELTYSKGKVVAPVKKGFISNLPIRVYESLRDGFLNSQPGLIDKIGIRCYACNHPNELEINAASFLISAPKKPTPTE